MQKEIALNFYWIMMAAEQNFYEYYSALKVNLREEGSGYNSSFSILIL
jgi:hypothetical protein